MQLVSDAPNRAFGAAAAAWARRLPAATPIVASDLLAVPHAFAEAARRRKRGEPFSAAVLAEDPRARCALYIAAPPVLAQIGDYDQRALLLEAIATGELLVGGRQQKDIERYDPRYLRSALEFLVTADVVVTRSSVEREYLCKLIGRRFTHHAEVAPLDPAVPPCPDRPERGNAIVVWAPEFPAEACGMLAFALEEFRVPAFIVCAGGQPAKMRSGTQFVGVSDAAAVLARAGAIVDASLSDPGTARALARWGVPLAVSSCSGAIDWLDGVTVFEPWNRLSIQAAVTNALASRSPHERRPDVDWEGEHARVLARATAPARPTGPLVSVIVPTLNRRASLRDAVASIAAQTYGNVELVLVNDGGPPIDRDSIEGPMRVELVECAQQRGVATALNVGIDASHGTYVALLADDDLFCPDHLARLVEALETSGAQIAHSIELAEVSEPDAGGSYTVVGHALIAGEPVRRTYQQLSNVIGGPSIMFTRAAYDCVGTFDDNAGSVSDMEMWMQMSERFDFIHVDRVTAVMSMRNDASQFSAVSGAKTADFYRYAYALHPTDRKYVREAREKLLKHLEEMPMVRCVPQVRISEAGAGDPLLG